MKSYTDIEQSRKLAEVLPLESADMYYEPSAGFCTELSEVKFGDIKYAHPRSIRCWSLAALLGVLPEYNLQRTDWGNKTEYKIVVTVNEDDYASKNYNNPIDACVAMIEKLHEIKLL